MSRLVGLLVFVMLLVGCSTDQQTMQLIEQAEQVMIDHPDSALRVIRSVDTETIRGEEDMSRYRLVMAEACYYNRIVPSRDSIAEPLFEYYLDSDDHAMRARAMYQHALVMMSDGENAKAMYSLLEAEKSLSHTDNHRLAGLVHRTKGVIYHNECLFQLSLEEYRKSKLLFDEVGLEEHSLYSLYKVAIEYNQLRKYKESIDILYDVYNIACEQNDRSLQNISLIDICSNYIELEEDEECLSIYPLIDVSCCQGYSVCDYYCIGAILEACRGNYQYAEKLLSIAELQTDRNQMLINYAMYRVQLFQNNCDRALETYRLMIAMQDEAVYNLINGSLLQGQIDLIDSERTLIEERAQIDKMRLICVIAVLVLIIATILLYARYLYVKRSRDIANYISVIAELEQSLKTATSNESSMIKSVDFIELNKICEIYYQYGNTTHISGKVVAAVNKSIDSLKNDEECLKNLENIVNSQHDNLLLDIREQCPKINNKEYRYIIYYLHGFSTRSIAMLLDIDTNALARLKYKVKVKLRECENDKIGMLLS